MLLVSCCSVCVGRRSLLALCVVCCSLCVVRCLLFDVCVLCVVVRGASLVV